MGNTTERAPRIPNESQATENLLILLAIKRSTRIGDGGFDFASSLADATGLTTRQVLRLLRKSGHVTITRDRSVGDNDYWCQLTSIPKITVTWA